MKTKVINLFGASGTGKSTLSSGLFYSLKLKHLNCELVREYIKTWAYENKVPTKNDQLYLLGKQSKYESGIYNKVEYIITDSPLLLTGFYHEYYHNNDYITKAGLAFMKESSVEYINFFLEPLDSYQEHGRYQTKEESDIISQSMYDWLIKNNINFTIIGKNVNDKVKFIESILRVSNNS